MIAYYDPKTRRRVSTRPDDTPPRRAPPGLVARWEGDHKCLTCDGWGVVRGDESTELVPCDDCAGRGKHVEVRWYDERGRLTDEQVAELGLGRKRGRPALGRKGRTQPVSIKLSADERATWGAAADREGLTLSDWLRAAAELAIARGSTR